MATHYHYRNRNRRQQRRRYFDSWLVLLVILMASLGTGLLGYHLGVKHTTSKGSRQVAAITTKTSQSKTESPKKEVKSAALNQYFQQQLNQIAQQNHYLGVAEVVYHGKVVATWTSGYANYQAQQRNTLSTGFEINSLQKGMTATLLMQQVTLKKVALTDHLAKYYPQVPGATQITLRQMLNMTSGLATPNGYNNTIVVPNQELINHDIANVRFTPEMQNKWQYQAINFILLAGIVEKVTGQSYQHLFQQQIIQPLHLKHTYFSYDLPTNYVRATGYFFKNGMNNAQPYLQPATINIAQKHSEFGTGQLYMSVHDLYRVEHSLLTGQLKNQPQILFSSGSTSHYGGGYYNYQTYKGVNGGGAGFESRVHISHNGENALILLTNVSGSRTNMDGMSKPLDQLLFNVQ